MLQLFLGDSRSYGGHHLAAIHSGHARPLLGSMTTWGPVTAGLMPSSCRRVGSVKATRGTQQRSALHRGRLPLALGALSGVSWLCFGPNSPGILPACHRNADVSWQINQAARLRPRCGPYAPTRPSSPRWHPSAYAKGWPGCLGQPERALNCDGPLLLPDHPGIGPCRSSGRLVATAACADGARNATVGASSAKGPASVPLRTLPSPADRSQVVIVSVSRAPGLASETTRSRTPEWPPKR